MNSQQQVTLWLGSFRYYLGRQSYAVSNFCELLIQEWATLPEQVQGLIGNELLETFRRDDEAREDETIRYYSLGMDMDRASWQKVLDAINEVSTK